MGVVAESTRQIEVLLEQLVVATGGARAMRQPPRLLVLPPVVPPIVPLHLMAGGGRAQRNSVGKSKAAIARDTSSEVTRALGERGDGRLGRTWCATDASAGPRWRAPEDAP